MDNSKFYILYATKDGNKYYIANEHPIIWNGNIMEAKRYLTRYSAECVVLRDYDNYKYFCEMIKDGSIDQIYVEVYSMTYNNVVDRARIL